MKLIIFLTFVSGCLALNNGLARTPPMGFMAWERFRCNTDCVKTPADCISERLLIEVADVMAAEGYREAGYQYVSVDDCWLDMNRTSSGELQPDAKRFPSGMKALIDYIHSKGLKFGIYGDIGTKTCAGYPGNYDHLEQDANTYAAWGVDMLKLDGCNVPSTAFYDTGYPQMTKYLNATGRPIMFSCSWPDYIRSASKSPNYTAVAESCNMWRNYNDIDDNWGSVAGIIDYYTKDEGKFSKVAGPGNFNDPDELVIGDYGLSISQQKTQMALWAIFASPLFVSADLRKISDESKAILLNKGVLKVNQDPLGVHGWKVFQKGSIAGYYKPLQRGGGAVALYSTDVAMPQSVTFTLKECGMTQYSQYVCQDTFSEALLGVYSVADNIELWVDPSGSSRLINCFGHS